MKKQGARAAHPGPTAQPTPRHVALLQLVLLVSLSFNVLWVGSRLRKSKEGNAGQHLPEQDPAQKTYLLSPADTLTRGAIESAEQSPERRSALLQDRSNSTEHLLSLGSDGRSSEVRLSRSMPRPDPLVATESGQRGTESTATDVDRAESRLGDTVTSAAQDVDKASASADASAEATPSLVEPAGRGVTVKPKKNASEMLKIGGKACGTEQDQRLVEFLRNVVLIINTRSSASGKVAGVFMRAIYQRYFETVIVIGPQSIQEYGVEARGHWPTRNKTSFAYLHLPSIMARHPDADGYLWLEEDVVLNYWTLEVANKSKIWFPSFRRCRRCQTFVPFNENKPEDFWDGWSGASMVRRIARRSFAHCELKYAHQFQASILPRKDGYRKMLADLFYIPKRHVDAFAFDLLPVFRDFGAPSQIAIPMMLHSLEDPSQYDGITKSMVYRLEKDDSPGALRFWKKKACAYHPWNPFSSKTQEQSLKILAKGDPCVVNVLPLIAQEGISAKTSE